MKKIIVDCEANDPIDIKIGGPNYLGFDFFVEDKDAKNMKKFILSELTKNKLPCIGIHITDEPRPNVKAWDKKMISKCIKEGY